MIRSGILRELFLEKRTVGFKVAVLRSRFGGSLLRLVCIGHSFQLWEGDLRVQNCRVLILMTLLKWHLLPLVSPEQFASPFASRTDHSNSGSVFRELQQSAAFEKSYAGSDEGARRAQEAEEG